MENFCTRTSITNGSPLMLLKFDSHICDTIKANESHVGNFQFWFFNINYLSIKHATFLIPIPSQSDIWLRGYEQFFHFRNSVKHKNLSPLLACNSTSIFPTSDSFPLIMSHIGNSKYTHNVARIQGGKKETLYLQ